MPYGKEAFDRFRANSKIGKTIYYEHTKSTFISGKMGNIIFYKRNGNYFARIAPDKVKQTAPTKTRSKNFDIAFSAGKTLQKLLLPSLPFPKDKKMQSRFLGAIAKC